MMELYIVRHAWAEPAGDPQWPDEKRPLTAEGRLRFAELVAKLAKRDFSPQLIATSPLLRCVETAQIIAENLPDPPQVVLRGELVPGSNLGGLVEWTVKQMAHYERIAWVGHAPDVGQMTAALMGGRDGLIHFGKGAMAALRFDDRPGRGSGELRWLLSAKVLGV